MTLQDLFGALEPSATEATDEVYLLAQVSLAISAKRIADTLESMVDHRYNMPALRTHERN